MGFRYGAQAKLFVLLLFIIRTRHIICAKDAITQTQKLSVGETILSPGQSFELGFFTPSNSSKQYIGIWYKSTSYRKVVWVANRESPLQASDSASSLEISEDGNLKLLDGMRNPIWRTNSSVQSNKSVAVLLDSGDLTLRDNVSGFILWESFNYPCDTFLPGMTLGLNTRTGEKHFLTSWKTEDDPSPGEFIAGLTPERPPQAFIWNGSEPYWRGGPWDGGKFMGIEDASEGYASLLKLQPDNQQGNVYLVMELYNSGFYAVMFITAEGSLKLMLRREDTEPMFLNWVAPDNPCEVYGYCGPFGVCAKNRSRMCECLKGFVPKSSGEWGGGNWSGGCVRRTQLLCGKNSGKAKSDGFWKLERAKLPDHFQYLFGTSSIGCQQWCVSNCSCLAYALVEKIGCMVWTGDLIDLQQYSSIGDDVFIRLAHSELGNGNKKGKLIASLTTISAVILMGGLIYGLRRSSASQRAKKYIRTSKSLSHDDMIRAPGNTSDFPVFEFEKILLATDNFSRANKLGEGGFGSVYKGKLENGQIIAVKRLSVHSGQGDQEFRNEIILISKLQHRNLVRLLGCCVEGEEKLLVYEYMANKSLDSFLFGGEEIAVKRLSKTSGQGIEEYTNEIILIAKLQHMNLVRLLGCCIDGDERMLLYEYMPNKSLDSFLFDPVKRAQLDWGTRFSIIEGIARALLYLHRDSRLRIIHRDLKASNILLDEDMTPKISDFGMAKIFGRNENQASTSRVVGTYGYMAPEYAMEGLFSVKSDVYSFGVLLLEIVSGRRNSSFRTHDYSNIIGYAWDLWERGKAMEMIDPCIADSSSKHEILRCIHIAMLCVQDSAIHRPIMSSVVLMLECESTALPLPRPRATTSTRVSSEMDELVESSGFRSENDLTLSVILGR